jgi:hypothetical protein
MSQHTDTLLIKEREEIAEDLPLTLSLGQAFGSIPPVSRPEDFAALRNAAIEDHIHSVTQKTNIGD